MTHLIAPSVNVFVVDGRRVLLSRRANTGWLDGYLCAPGGHIEKGETPIDAMLREIKEELGVSVDPNDLEFLCVAARNGTPTEYVAYEFLLRGNKYEFANAEPDKCSELIWADLDNLPDDIISDFRNIIDQALIGGQKFLQIGYDTLAKEVQNPEYRQH